MKIITMILILTTFISTSAVGIANIESEKTDKTPMMNVSEQKFFNSLLPEQQADLLERHWQEKERLKGKEHLTFKRAFQSPEIIAQRKKLEQESLKGLSYVTVGSFAICNYSTIQAAVNAVSSGETIRVTNETFNGDDALFNVTNKSLIFRGGYTHCGTSAVVSGRTNLSGTGMSFNDSIVELTDTIGGMNIDFYDFVIAYGQPDSDFGGGIEVTGKGLATSAQRLDLLLSNVNVFANQSGVGGGIHMTNGDMILSNNSNISSNRAGGDGGGIYCRDGTILVNGDAVIGNNGVLFNLGNIADSDENGTGTGGGVFLEGCDLTLDASDGLTGAYIIGNMGLSSGGIYALSSSINNSTINLLGDKAQVNLNESRSFSMGAGIRAVDSSEVNIKNGSVLGNIGGGIALTASDLDMHRDQNLPCTGKCNQISENTIYRPDINTGAGGVAIDSAGLCHIYVTNAWIENNYNHSGIIHTNSVSSAVLLSNVMIVGNNVDYDGTDRPLIDTAGGTVIKYSTIAGNTAKVRPTSLFIFDSPNYETLSVYNNIFADNEPNFVFGGTGDFNENSQYQLENIIQVNAMPGTQDPQFVAPGSDYHILPGSPAIDFGSVDLDIPRDVDNEIRPNNQFDTPDAGADEQFARVGINGAICQYSTITETIAAASDGDTIYIRPGNYIENPGTISKSLTFVQSNNSCEAEEVNVQAADLVIDGSNNFTALGGLFSVSSNKNVSFKNMTLQNAKASYGGILYASTGTNLLLDNVVVKGGSVTQYGGGIRSLGSVQLINGSKVINNNATSLTASDNQRGAGVAISSTGSLSVEDNSVIVDNDAVKEGGGIYSDGHITMVDSARIFANSGTDGGGVYVSSTGSLALYDSSKIGESGFGNSATSGGGVYCLNATLTLNDNSKVISNQATAGGGIYGDSCIVSLLEHPFVGELGAGNAASIAGGGLYLTNASSLLVDNNVSLTPDISYNTAQFGAGLYIQTSGSDKILSELFVHHNIASSQGGGILIGANTDAALMQLDNMVISANQARNGGGVAYQSINTARFEVNHTNLDHNSASESGGGIYVFGSVASTSMQFFNTHLSFNQATFNGGGVAVEIPATLTTLGSTFVLNQSAIDGGGLFLSHGAGLDAQTTQFERNFADTGNGGGIYIDATLQDSTVVMRNQSQVFGNRAIDGAGIFVQGDQSTSSSVSIFDTLVYDNAASNTGGALYTQYAVNSIRSTKMYGNTAHIDGAAFKLANSNSTIWNSVFYDNIALGNSYVIREGHLNVSESTFVNFTTPAAFVINGTVQLELNNSILSGFSDTLIGVATAGMTTQCNLDNTGELGAINSPLFIDAANNDYHLQASSPAINKCSTGSVDDYEHNSRPVGSGATPYDIGAFEYQGNINQSDIIFMNGFE